MGVDQGLEEGDVTSHGLRGGASKDMNTACGGKILQDFGNWLSDAYKTYQDSSRLKDWTSFARKMAAVGSTNAQAMEELQVKKNARRIMERAREARS